MRYFFYGIFFVTVLMPYHSLLAKGGSIDLSIQQNEEFYKNSSVGVSYYVNERTSLGYSYEGVEDSDEFTSKTHTINSFFTAKRTYDFNISLGHGKESGQLTSNNFSLSYGIKISDYWEGINRTRLTLGLEINRYTRPNGVVGDDGHDLEDEYTKKGLTIGLSQEIGEYVAINAHFTGYRYSDRANEEQKLDLGELNFSGYEAQAWSLGVDYYPFSWLEFGLSYGVSRNYGSPTQYSDTTANIDTFIGKHWSFSLSATQSSHYSNTYGLSTSYLF